MAGNQGRKLAWTAAAVVAAFLMVALASTLYEKYRPVAHRRFLIPTSFTGKVYLLHAKRKSWLESLKARAPETFSVPTGGILVASNPMPDRYGDTYFDVSPDGTAIALAEMAAGSIENTPANQQDQRRVVFNPSSELLQNEQCMPDIETFYVGSPAALLFFKEDDRMDRFIHAHPEICPAK